MVTAHFDRDQPERSFAFFVANLFALNCVSSAVDTLRVANRLMGRDAFDWRLLSIDGRPVRASNGIEVSVNGTIADWRGADMLSVCAGLELDPQPRARLHSELHQASRSGLSIGAICAGAVIVARAGLLNGKRCTIHWENASAFVEDFPDVEYTGKVYEIDGNRYSAAGGISSVDLMLHMVGKAEGRDLVDAIANQMVLDRIRTAEDPQRTGMIGMMAHLPAKLRQAIEIMCANIDEPLSIKAIADAVQLSVRQIERLFLNHTGLTPGRYYMRVRLERARELIVHTSRPILDIALATGFSSSSYFAQCYRLLYGINPSSLRRGNEGTRTTW